MLVQAYLAYHFWLFGYKSAVTFLKDIFKSISKCVEHKALINIPSLDMVKKRRRTEQ